MDNLIARIENALDQIRPYLEADQGGIKLVEVTDDFLVKVELQGACVNCSMSYMTMKAGVEETIKRMAPEVIGVEAINALKQKA